jgi:hypothetical protein
MQTRRSLIFAGASALALAPQCSQAQTAPTGGQLFYREGRYLPYWRELQPQGGSLAAYFAAFLGEEGYALGALEPPEMSDALTPDARAKDAVSSLMEAAAGRKVVILNEAHEASRHRSFLAVLLRALRPIGFTHLACETFLNAQDERAPNIRRFVSGEKFDRNYGFYTDDPVFAEAVREAAQLGYRFAAYEMRRDQQGSSDEGQAQAIARREEAQADNFIAEGLLSDANARVLVYCGFDHLRETPTANGGEWFARRLARKASLDPLTITQAFTGSFGPHVVDPPLTQEVLRRFSPASPIIVEQARGVLGAAAMGADFAVFHPARPDVRRRPGWLAADPVRREVRIRLPRRLGDEPALAQAVHAHEPDPAVPADQYMLKHGARSATFFLRRGRYRVRLETLSGFEPLDEIEV